MHVYNNITTAHTASVLSGDVDAFFHLVFVFLCVLSVTLCLRSTCAMLGCGEGQRKRYDDGSVYAAV